MTKVQNDFVDVILERIDMEITMGRMKPVLGGFPAKVRYAKNMAANYMFNVSFEKNVEVAIWFIKTWADY